jgi:hypothetical protein
MAHMADKPASKDMPSDTLDLIINILKNHEQNLDKSIEQLATIIDEIDDQKAVAGKLEGILEKLCKLERHLETLAGHVAASTNESPAKRSQT